MELLKQIEGGHMLPSSYPCSPGDEERLSVLRFVCVRPSSDISEKVVFRLVFTALSTFCSVSSASCHSSRRCHLSAMPCPPLVTWRIPSACRSSRARRTAVVLYCAV